MPDEKMSTEAVRELLDKLAHIASFSPAVHSIHAGLRSLAKEALDSRDVVLSLQIETETKRRYYAELFTKHEAQVQRIATLEQALKLAGEQLAIGRRFLPTHGTFGEEGISDYEFAQKRVAAMKLEAGREPEVEMLVRCASCNSTLIWKCPKPGEIHVYHNCGNVQRHLERIATLEQQLTAAKERIEELVEALRTVAFHVPIVRYEHDKRRYVDIEDIFTLKRVAANARDPEGAAMQDGGTKP